MIGSRFMRLLAFLALALVLIGAGYFWLTRPSVEPAVVGNAAADQQAIDAANRDIENEERAAAAGLAGGNNVAAATGNGAR